MLIEEKNGVQMRIGVDDDPTDRKCHEVFAGVIGYEGKLRPRCEYSKSYCAIGSVVPDSSA